MNSRCEEVNNTLKQYIKKRKKTDKAFANGYDKGLKKLIKKVKKERKK